MSKTEIPKKEEIKRKLMSLQSTLIAVDNILESSEYPMDVKLVKVSKLIGIASSQREECMIWVGQNL